MKTLLGKYDAELASLIKRKSELESQLRQIVLDTIANIAKTECKINKISNHCFTIKFSDLIGNPWSPTYHNWESSIPILITYLESKPVFQWVACLQKKLSSVKPGAPIIFETKCRVCGYPVTHKHPLSYEFIDKVLKRLYELPSD